jgi:hypothetical protein
MSLHELGNTEAMLKSADFELDYLNKVIATDSKTSTDHIDDQSPLGISESPLAAKNIMSKARFTDQDLAKGSATSKVNLNDDSHDSIQTRLPVDKGIFRRKLHVQSNKPTTADIESPADTDDNMTAEHVPKFLGTSKADDDDKQKKASQVHNSTFLDPIWSLLGFHQQQKPKPFGSSTSQLEQDKSFVEHRKEIVRKWKENIREKLMQNEDSAQLSPGRNKDIEQAPEVCF